MSEENNWNYGNDEPNVNQGNPVSLEKSTTDGTAGVNLEKTVTGNEERVNSEKTMTDNPYYTNTSYGNGNTNYNYGQSNDSAGSVPVSAGSPVFLRLFLVSYSL